jgi:DNA-binding transcriptional LysR family regulator
MIDYKSAEILVAVIREGSSNAAANSLRLAPSAVRNAIRRLEDELRFPLLEKLGGRLHATPELVALLPQFETMERSLARVRTTTQELQSNEMRTLSVAALPSLASTMLPVLIGRFMAEAPWAKLKLSIDGVEKRLLSGECDFGFTFEPFIHPEIENSKIWTGQLVCVATPGSPLWSGTDPVSIVDAIDSGLVGFSPQTSPFGREMEKAAQEAGREYTPIITASHSLTACVIARACGLAAVIDTLLLPTLDSGIYRCRRLVPEIEVNAYVSMLKGRLISREIELFEKIVASTSATPHRDAPHP